MGVHLCGPFSWIPSHHAFFGGLHTLSGFVSNELVDDGGACTLKPALAPNFTNQVRYAVCYQSKSVALERQKQGSHTSVALAWAGSSYAAVEMEVVPTTLSLSNTQSLGFKNKRLIRLGW